MKFNRFNGYLWPKQDIEMRRVAFSWLPDLDRAVEYCEQRKVAVQAGGNCGVWPARIAETFELVYTFEPEETNFFCLRQNVPSNVRMFNAALGDKTGAIKMSGLPDNCGAYRVDGEGNIPIMLIDNLALKACDLIQLDIEGMEFAALQGAKNTIRKFSPIIMIEDNGLCRHYGIEPGDCGRWLATFGYDEVASLHRDRVYRHRSARKVE